MTRGGNVIVEECLAIAHAFAAARALQRDHASSARVFASEVNEAIGRATVALESLDAAHAQLVEDLGVLPTTYKVARANAMLATRCALSDVVLLIAELAGVAGDENETNETKGEPE